MAPLPAVTESPRIMLIQLSGDGSGAPEQKQIVGERHVMTNEAVLPQCYVLTNKRVRLYPTSTTNDTAFLYLNEGADKHIVPEFTFINVDRFDNTDIGPINHIPDSTFHKFHTHTSFKYR